MEATETKERGRIIREGMGGFLTPPGYPERAYSVEYDLTLRKENRGTMSLSYAVECDWLDDATRAEAQRILDAWQAPDISSREVQMWIKQCWSHWRNCYKLDGERELFVMQSQPFSDLPTVQGRGLHMIIGISQHQAVVNIRRYYPEYVPSVRDMTADCQKCGHHVNAHDNGNGGECRVITDQPAYDKIKNGGWGRESAEMRATLCLCPEYVAA